jgi:GTP cyclohydrolase I
MTVVEPDRFAQHSLQHQRLRVVPGRGEIDLVAAEQAVADLLVALGNEPAGERLADTPRRVAKSYAELLTPPAFELTTFPNDEGYDELVLARSIPVNSLCEHHLLPFHGAGCRRIWHPRASAW